MAALAVGSANSIELPLVWVLMAVGTLAPLGLAPGTAGAGRRRQGFVACRTVQLAVLARQFEARKRGVIKTMGQCAEGRGVMATNAAAAAFQLLRHVVSIKDPFVRIPVARVAGSKRTIMLWDTTKASSQGIGLLGASMAVGTLDLTMCTIDGKPGPIRVIKPSVVEFCPGQGVMAGRALPARLRIEHVLLAGKGGSMRILMAAFATAVSAMKHAHLAAFGHMVTRGALLIGMLPG